MDQNSLPPSSAPVPPPRPGDSPSPAGSQARTGAERAKEAAAKTGQQAKKFFDRAWPHVKPVIDSAWLNLRVWVPFLANPQFRECQVAYGARESRDGTRWDVSLPQQCWQCNTTTAVQSRTYERSLRTFDTPVAILACALGVAGFFFLLSVWIGSFLCFLISLFCVLGGLGFLYVKSWPEQARIVVSTCAEHADALRCPDLVVHDNVLYVMAFSPELAEVARAELNAKRKAGNRYAESPPAPTAAAQTPRRETTAIPLSDEPPPAASSDAASRAAIAGYKRSELPPISLDDDANPPAPG